MHISRSLTASVCLTLACLACTISLGGPPMPADSTAPSPEALTSFNEKWRSLPEMLSNGDFTLTLTEEEVASVIDAALTNPDPATGPDIPLQNTRIDLDNCFVLYAQTDGRPFSASGMMTLLPSVDPDGQLTAQVQSSDFGRVSLDEAMLEQIGATVADALTSPADNLPVSVVLTSASVVDDQLVLAGNIVE